MTESLHILCLYSGDNNSDLVGLLGGPNDSIPVKCSVQLLAQRATFQLMVIIIAVITITPFPGLSFLGVGLLDFPGPSQL